MRSRPFGLSLALMLATVAGGLAVRFAHVGLPPFVTKYGGSTLWALTVYWIVSTLLPSWRRSEFLQPQRTGQPNGECSTTPSYTPSRRNQTGYLFNLYRRCSCGGCQRRSVDRW